MSRNEDLFAAVLNIQNDVGYIKGKVEAIETQTKKTNGRVTKNENKIALIITTLAVLVVLLAVSNPSFHQILSLIPIK